MSLDQKGLRPYYNPATFNSPLKLRDPPAFSTYSGANVAATSSAPILSNSSYAVGSIGSKTVHRVAGSSGGAGSGQQQHVDFDLDFGTTGDTVAEIGRSMARLYGKIFFSQPWRVGRLLLQVGDWSEEEGVSGGGGYDYDEQYEHENEDEYDQFEHVHGRKNLSEFGGDVDIPHAGSGNGRRKLYEEEPHEYAIRSSSSLSFRGGNRREEIEEAGLEEEEEEEDEMSYFTNVAGDLSTRNIRTKSPGKPKRQIVSRTQSVMDHRRPASRMSRSQSHIGHVAAPSRNSGQFKIPKKPKDEEYINRIRPETIKFSDVIASLQAQDGLKSLWRGVNTSFILDAMQVTLEAWLSGFFSSISGVPDPHFLEISHSPTPGASLVTAVAASVVTAVLLAPLSIVRTRLVTTTFETVPRSIRTSVRDLPSWVCPTEVLVPTVLYAGITSTLRKSTSYVLQILLGVDPTSMPAIYSVMTLLSSLLEVGVRLPLETLLRRAHMAYLHLPAFALLVKPVDYDGVFGTAWSIMNGRVGANTLYRGWRVSMLGVLSEWGVETLDRSEREKEQF